MYTGHETRDNAPLVIIAMNSSYDEVTGLYNPSFTIHVNGVHHKTGKSVEQTLFAIRHLQIAHPILRIKMSFNIGKDATAFDIDSSDLGRILGPLFKVIIDSAR